MRRPPSPGPCPARGEGRTAGAGSGFAAAAGSGVAAEGIAWSPPARQCKNPPPPAPPAQGEGRRATAVVEVGGEVSPTENPLSRRLRGWPGESNLILQLTYGRGFEVYSADPPRVVRIPAAVVGPPTATLRWRNTSRRRRGPGLRHRAFSAERSERLRRAFRIGRSSLPSQAGGRDLGRGVLRRRRRRPNPEDLAWC
jgi:hypothetical protein